MKERLRFERVRCTLNTLRKLRTIRESSVNRQLCKLSKVNDRIQRLSTHFRSALRKRPSRDICSLPRQDSSSHQSTPNNCDEHADSYHSDAELEDSFKSNSKCPCERSRPCLRPHLLQRLSYRSSHKEDTPTYTSYQSKKSKSKSKSKVKIKRTPYRARIALRRSANKEKKQRKPPDRNFNIKKAKILSCRKRRLRRCSERQSRSGYSPSATCNSKLFFRMFAVPSVMKSNWTISSFISASRIIALLGRIAWLAWPSCN